MSEIKLKILFKKLIISKLLYKILFLKFGFESLNLFIVKSLAGTCSKSIAILILNQC